MSPKQIADAYRMRYPERAHGVIIIYGSHVAGWCETLPQPMDWEPKCVAITEDGQEYVAVGGSEQDGAERWQKDG